MTTQKTQKQEDLDISLEDQFEFFGEEKVVEEVKNFEKVETGKDKKEKKKKEELPFSDDEEDKKKDKEELEEVSDNDFDFAPPKKVEEEKRKKEETSKEGEDKIGTFEAIKKIYKEGFLTFDEGEEEKEITEENAEEIFEEGFKKAVKSEVGLVLDTLPPEVSAIVKYSLDGGDTKELLKNYGTDGGLAEDMNMDEESNQELAVKNKLEAEGFDEEYIKDEIEALKERGKLGTVSKTYHRNWKKQREKERQNKIKETERKKQEQLEKERETKEYYTKKLKSEDEIGGLKITKEDRKVLPSYLLDKKYKLSNGTLITEHQKDVYEVFADKEKSLLHAKILRTGLDLEKIKQLVEDEFVEKFEDKVRETKVLDSKSSQKVNTKYNPMDYFN